MEKLPVEEICTTTRCHGRRKKCYNVVFRKSHREKRVDDQPATNECIFNTLPDILKTYKPFYVFNASRTGLYFRMLPDSLDIIKKICQGGGRHKKEILYQLVDPKTTISYLLAVSVIWGFYPNCDANFLHRCSTSAILYWGKIGTYGSPNHFVVRLTKIHEVFCQMLFLQLKSIKHALLHMWECLLTFSWSIICWAMICSTRGKANNHLVVIKLLLFRKPMQNFLIKTYNTLLRSIINRG